MTEFRGAKPPRDRGQRPATEREVSTVVLGRLTELDFDAVIFDMDGTLIDSTPAVIRAWTIWAKSMA